MRIVMLGHSGVGKTTYMAAVYGELQSPHGGFFLRAEDPDDHRRFLDIADRISVGEYPAGTDQRETYRFILRHRTQDVFSFDWADYRGGALMEQSVTDETRKVREDLVRADGVVIFCDSRKLQRGQSTAKEMGRLSQLLGSSLASVDKDLPVVIVLTKRDCVKQIDERITQWIDPIVECLRGSDRLKGAVVPVACGPEASDVPLPLLFVLCHGIQRKARQLHELVSQHTENAQRLTAKGATFFGAVEDVWGQFWEGVDPRAYPHSTYAERAGDALGEARKLQKVLEPLVEPAKALARLLEGVQAF